MSAFTLRPGVDLCAYMNDTSSLDNCDQQGIPKENRTVNPCYLMKPYRKEDTVSDIEDQVCAHVTLALKKPYV